MHSKQNTNNQSNFKLKFLLIGLLGFSQCRIQIPRRGFENLDQNKMDYFGDLVQTKYSFEKIPTRFIDFKQQAEYKKYLQNIAPVPRKQSPFFQIPKKHKQNDPYKQKQEFELHRQKDFQKMPGIPLQQIGDEINFMNEVEKRPINYNTPRHENYYNWQQHKKQERGAEWQFSPQYLINEQQRWQQKQARKQKQEQQPNWDDLVQKFGYAYTNYPYQNQYEYKNGQELQRPGKYQIKYDNRPYYNDYSQYDKPLKNEDEIRKYVDEYRNYGSNLVQNKPSKSYENDYHLRQHY